MKEVGSEGDFVSPLHRLERGQREKGALHMRKGKYLVPLPGWGGDRGWGDMFPRTQV